MNICKLISKQKTNKYFKLKSIW